MTGIHYGLMAYSRENEIPICSTVIQKMTLTVIRILGGINFLFRILCKLSNTQLPNP